MAMLIKKPFISLALMTVFFILYSPLFATDYGPIFTLSYLPSGYGTMERPHTDGSNGTEKFLPRKGSKFSSATQSNISIGYYYGFLQGDIGYTDTGISHQLSGGIPGIGQESDSMTNYSCKARFGKRFSNPGDTSYNWIYIGCKRMSLSSSGINMDIAAYGYFFGYMGFFSFDLGYDIEFVFTSDIYLGSYRVADFSSDVAYKDASKRYSISAGGSLGLGAQYEPYNITLLLKAAGDFDRFRFNATYNDSSRSFICSSLSITIGFEVIYSIPNIHYNKLPNNSSDIKTYPKGDRP
jgi:hypothetical protein